VKLNLYKTTAVSSGKNTSKTWIKTKIKDIKQPTGCLMMEYRRNKNGKRQNMKWDQRHTYSATKLFEQTNAGIS
jgi:hypothetical protein